MNRRNRNKKRRKLRKQGISEVEIMRQVPIPGTTYADHLDRVLRGKGV